MVICAKTAEVIEMQFGLWASMGRRSHVLDWSRESLPWQPILRLKLLFTGFVATKQLIMEGV